MIGKLNFQKIKFSGFIQVMSRNKNFFLEIV